MIVETRMPLPVAEPITGRKASERGLLRDRGARCCDDAPSVSSEEAAAGRYAFFDYRGPGSDRENLCANCGYQYVAHTVEGMKDNVPNNRRTVIELGKCAEFVSAGPAEYDGYYCGHGGWD